MYFSVCIKSDDEEDEVRIIVMYCTLNCLKINKKARRKQLSILRVNTVQYAVLSVRISPQ